MLKKSINITTNYCLINVKKTTKNGQSKKNWKRWVHETKKKNHNIEN